MKRRDFLKYSGALVTQSFIASTMLDSVFISTAHGQTVSIRDLKMALHPNDGTILVPQDADFAKYNSSFNKRVFKTPIVRVLCATPEAVAIAIQWAQANKVPLALRSGGHSFEGFSHGTGLVIDTRPMNEINISGDKQVFAVGAGVMLGKVYEQLSEVGRSVPAGTCPTVGITGHTLGGGYGMLARPFGLACDSLLSVSLVNVHGEILNCSASENQDLFWALRGGGAGSLGVVTKLQFKAHEVVSVRTYSMGFKVGPRKAARFLKTWQQWAPNASREITSLMNVSKKDDLISVRFVGQTIGSERALRKELSALTSIQEPEALNIKDRPYLDSVKYFGGGEEPPIYMKGKSDYLKSIMTDQGIATFLENIPSGIAVIFDAYGGAISDVHESETAFAHRAGTLCSMQYYSQWSKAESGPTKLATLKTFHDLMRPHVSGSAYFNYCDLDIKDYAKAYWGNNLARLTEIKTKYDPTNFFQHAQSIPLK